MKLKGNKCVQQNALNVKLDHLVQVFYFIGDKTEALGDHKI